MRVITSTQVKQYALRVVRPPSNNQTSCGLQFITHILKKLPSFVTRFSLFLSDYVAEMLQLILKLNTGIITTVKLDYNL